MTSSPQFPRIHRLLFDDEPLGTIEHAGATLPLLRGLGSGLARREGSDPALVWAIGDRGPNIPTPDRRVKILPAPWLGPAISELRVGAQRVTLLRSLPLRARGGEPISGLPLPGEAGEIAVDLAGKPYAGDPMGADTEGLAVARDGTFRVADEYGPSILHATADGRIHTRWVPIGTGGRYQGADCVVVECLPAIAATRRLNRGFEGLALSLDERWLYVAFQSALPADLGQYCRIWRLDAATGVLAEEYQYPFDEPHTFIRDRALGEFQWSDLKLCELVCVDARRLLVLERGSATSRLYLVRLPEPLQGRGTSSAAAPILVKSLVLNTDDHPEIGVDLEGVTLLSPRTLLLVNDNDFGIDGVTTQFWRVDLPTDV